MRSVRSQVSWGELELWRERSERRKMCQIFALLLQKLYYGPRVQVNKKQSERMMRVFYNPRFDAREHRRYVKRVES